MRVGLGLSKYLVWAIMAVVVQFARRATPIVPPDQRIEVPEWFWPSAAVLMLTTAYGLFVRRSMQRRSAPPAADADEKITMAEPHAEHAPASTSEDAKKVKGG